MAVVFQDGFDTYNGAVAVKGLAAKYTVNGAATLVAGRFGGLALRCPSNGQGIQYNMAAGVASFTFAAGFRPTAGSVNVRPILMFKSGATYMLGFLSNTNGGLDIYRLTSGTGGTLLGSTTPGALLSGVWYGLEIEVVISDTVGRVTIYADGTQIANITAADTRNGTPTTIDTICMGHDSATGAPQVDYDDVFMLDAAARPADNQRIETLYVTADGATLNFTPSTGTAHYAVVDEAVCDDADYLSGTTVGDLDELVLGDLSTTPASILNVSVVAYAKKTDAAVRSIYLGVKSGATNSDGTAANLSSTGVRHERFLPTDPNTAAAWTAANVNAMQLRPKIAA